MKLAILILFGLTASLLVARYGRAAWFAVTLWMIRLPRGDEGRRRRDAANVRSYCRGFVRGAFIRLFRGEGKWRESILSAKAEMRTPMVEGACFSEAALRIPMTHRPVGACWDWPRCFALGVHCAVRYGRGYEEVLRVAQSVDPWLRYLCLEGYGFKFGLLEFPERPGSIAHFQAIPGFYRRAVFQGLGRALYLVYLGNRRGLIDVVGDVAPEHETDIIEGAAFQSVFIHGAEPQRVIHLAQAVPYEWRAHAHLGLVLGFRALGAVDPPALRAVLGRLPGASAEAVRQAVHLCDELESRLRAEHPVSGYGLWRELVSNRLDEEQVLEPCYASADGRTGNKGVVS